MSDKDESVIQFPCDFPVKAMGLASYNLEVIVFDIVTQHAPDTSKDALKTRESSNGKYISITVTVSAQSQAQLDAIYQALTDHEHVMMAL